MYHRKKALGIISLFVLCSLLLGSTPGAPTNAAVQPPPPEPLAAPETPALESLEAGDPAAPDALQYGLDLAPVPPALISQSMAAVRHLNFTYAQYYLSWRDVEPGEDNGTKKDDKIKWKLLDPIVHNAWDAGVHLVFRIYQAPEWAKVGAPSNAPANLIELARFVGALVRRYGTHVSAYVIWNEPNTSAGWEGRTLSAKAYVDCVFVKRKRAHLFIENRPTWGTKTTCSASLTKPPKSTIPPCGSCPPAWPLPWAAAAPSTTSLTSTACIITG